MEGDRHHGDLNLWQLCGVWRGSREGTRDKAVLSARGQHTIRKAETGRGRGNVGKKKWNLKVRRRWDRVGDLVHMLWGLLVSQPAFFLDLVAAGVHGWPVCRLAMAEKRRRAHREEKRVRCV